MNCQFDWCTTQYEGHTEHWTDTYVPVSQSPSRKGLRVGAGVVVEEAFPDTPPRVFLHINDAEDLSDEDAYMTADEGEAVLRALSAGVAIARNPQPPQSISRVVAMTVLDGYGRPQTLVPADQDVQCEHLGELPTNEVTGPIPTGEEVGKRLKPDDGDHTSLAHFKSGEAEAIVERYDYRMPDGTVDSEYEVLGNWPDHGCGVADFQLQRKGWQHLDDMIAVLTAVRLFTRELVLA